VPDLTLGPGVVVQITNFGPPVVTMTAPSSPVVDVVPVAGPQGPPGIIPGREFVQVTPAATWTIPLTGFTRTPQVEVYVGGQLVGTDVVASSMQVVITFASPQSGSAVIL
jgi:hypothetical protein